MKRATVLVVMLFALSGICGLIHELVWIRLFSRLLGGTTFAIGVVLASFMGGLGLGSFLLGRRADRSRRPLRLYALLELGVALSAAAVPLAVVLVEPAYVALARAVPAPVLGVARVLFAFVIMFVPTFLMGGTLPVLSRFVVRRHDRLGRGLGLLYAINTLGAVLGTFLAGFVLIPALGLPLCVALAAGGNLLSGLAALLVARGLSLESRAALASRATPPSAPARGGPPPPAAAAELDPRLLAAVFALTGFAAFGYEIYWTRSLVLFLGNSTYAFSTMLTTYLLGLAAGGWLGGFLADRSRSPARLLGWLQIGVAAAALATVPLIWNGLTALAGGEALGGRQLTWPQYLGRRFLLAAAVMAPASLLSGMTFPVVNRIGIASLARIGRGVGRLYLANTAGGIAGALAAGFALLPLLGARAALLATALLSGLVGLAVLAARRGEARRPPLRAVAVVAVLAAAALPLGRAARLPPSDTQSRWDEVLLRVEDRVAETRVYDKTNGERHMSVDGRHIGGTGASMLRKEKILAHLPLALVPDARRVLAVGLGTGITLGTLALHPGIEHLTCLEIVPGVVRGAALFREHNHGVLDDPRTEIRVGDGVQHLLTTDERYDVISSDSKLNPEFAGNSAILSRDYYELCAARLAERGVMVQWLGFNFPRSELDVVLRSFAAAFPEVELFWIDYLHLVLAGSRAPLVLDLARYREFLQVPALRADLEAMRLDDPHVLAAHHVTGGERLRAALGAGPVNTWLHPRLEFAVVPQYRLQDDDGHIDDNLRWLAGVWSDAPLAVTGLDDPDRLARFRASTRKYFDGMAVVKSSRGQLTGEADFRAGLALNPEDFRIAGYLEHLAARAPAGAAAAGPGADVQERFAACARLQAANRLAEAVACFESLVADHPDDPQVRLGWLQALRRSGARERALDGAVQLADAFPARADVQAQLGFCRLETGDLPGALAAFGRAAELAPASHEQLSNYASTLVRLERYAEAAAAFARIHAMAPSLGQAAVSAAACYSKAGLTAEAAAWVDICLEQQLADPATFLTSANFANLRASPHWDAARIDSLAARRSARGGAGR